MQHSYQNGGEKQPEFHKNQTAHALHSELLLVIVNIAALVVGVSSIKPQPCQPLEYPIPKNHLIGHHHDITRRQHQPNLLLDNVPSRWQVAGEFAGKCSTFSVRSRQPPRLLRRRAKQFAERNASSERGSNGAARVTIRRAGCPALS
jgi:hypothetical protein